MRIRLAEIKRDSKLTLQLAEGSIEFVDGRAEVTDEQWEAIPAKFKGPGKGILQESDEERRPVGRPRKVA